MTSLYLVSAEISFSTAAFASATSSRSSCTESCTADPVPALLPPEVFRPVLARAALLGCGCGCAPAGSATGPCVPSAERLARPTATTVGLGPGETA